MNLRMHAIVSPFALLGRRTSSADYEALRLAAAAARPARRAHRRVAGTLRWTGSSDIVERPARFAA